MGIERRHLTLQETQDIVESYKKGESATSIAKRLGKVTKVVTGALQRNGIPVNSERHVASTFTEHLEEAKRLYQEGASCKEVGAKLGFSEMTVHNHLKAAGVSIRPRGNPVLTHEQILRIVEEYKTLSMHELAEKYGHSISVIHRALHKAGADVRGMGPSVEFGDGKIRCNTCQEFKYSGEFAENPKHASGHNYQCKDCERWAKRERAYGITREQYQELQMKQQGCCAICGVKWEGTASHPDLVVDHNHATGQVRGLLCPDCNQMLGHAKDSQETLQKALAYLRLHAVAPAGTL